MHLDKTLTPPCNGTRFTDEDAILNSINSIVVAVSCFLGACAPLPETRADDAEAIRAASARFSQAFVDGDAQTMAETYTEDGVLMPPGREAIDDPESILAYWTLRPGRKITAHASIPIEIVVDGDHAFDRGHYEIAGETNGNPWGPRRGTYLIVWERGDDGRWRMAVDMWTELTRE